MPPLTVIRDVAKVGAELAPQIERGVLNLVDLVRPAAKLAEPTEAALQKAFAVNTKLPDGLHLTIQGPKGEVTQAIASSKLEHLEGFNLNMWHTTLRTPSREPIASTYYSLELASAKFATPYGPSRELKSSLNLELMNIEEGFRGRGVREALVGAVREFSEHIGLNGRVKLLAVNDLGTVSAIPWFKSGFRVQPHSGLEGTRFQAVAFSLHRAVSQGAHVPLEKGNSFANLPMYLPERKLPGS